MSGVERHVGLARGTRDWLQADYARLRGYERTLMGCFARAGYRPARTPVLELSDLHERKSGAGIVGKLFEVSGAGTAGICLRPELTAGLVRAYVESDEPPPLPWRAAVSGPVFRFQPTAEGVDREFIQTGVELIGAGGPAAGRREADEGTSPAPGREPTLRRRGHDDFPRKRTEPPALPCEGRPRL